MLNSSLIHHQILHDINSSRGVTVTLMGVEFLFKQTKVDYIKDTASFGVLCVIEHYSAQLNCGKSRRTSSKSLPPGSRLSHSPTAPLK
jgi:hypothetical protein